MADGIDSYVTAFCYGLYLPADNLYITVRGKDEQARVCFDAQPGYTIIVTETAR
jgi:hypothetical protein